MQAISSPADQMTDGATILLLLAAAYFLPSLIAGVRGRPNTMAIFALNLFLGWTLLGWVLALVWSLSSAGQPVVQQVVVDQRGASANVPRRKQKKCIACAEWIMKDAMKCKHCGEMQAGYLVGGPIEEAQPVAVVAPPPPPPPTPASPTPAENQSVSISHWLTDEMPPHQPKDFIDWGNVRHSDKNVGRP